MEKQTLCVPLQFQSMEVLFSTALAANALQMSIGLDLHVQPVILSATLVLDPLQHIVILVLIMLISMEHIATLAAPIVNTVKGVPQPVLNVIVGPISSQTTPAQQRVPPQCQPPQSHLILQSVPHHAQQASICTGILHAWEVVLLHWPLRLLG